MYADDICALQKLLDVCYEYGIINDLIYNPLKLKLYCPTVAKGDGCLKYVITFKYLRFLFSENKKDDADMNNAYVSLLYCRCQTVVN